LGDITVDLGRPEKQGAIIPELATGAASEMVPGLAARGSIGRKDP